MEAHPVDPRDTTVEVDQPTYRVYFWENMSSGESKRKAVYRADEYELTGASDVREVLDWAETNAGPRRTFTIHIVLDRRLIRLLGENPTANPPTKG